MTTTDIEPVIATVRVGVPPDRAWTTFTRRFGEWWPAVTHSIGEHEVVAVAIEEGVDGRVYERWSDGTEHAWGRITVWSPLERLAFSWRPSLDTTNEPTHVEVTFTPLDGGTEVRLTHTGWQVLGEHAAGARAAYHDGWPHVLQLFVEAINT